MNQIFGHFSESEVEKISGILEKNNVSFTVEVDSKVQEDIADSMKNNIRYLHGATICNDLLIIKADAEEIKKLPFEEREELKELRFFWEEPEFDFGDEEGSDDEERLIPAPQSYINSQEGNRNKVIGIVFFISLALGLVVAIFNYAG